MHATFHLNNKVFLYLLKLYLYKRGNSSLGSDAKRLARNVIGDPFYRPAVCAAVRHAQATPSFGL